MSSRDELMQSSGTIPVDSAAGKRDPPQEVSDHVALMVPRVTYFPQSRVTTRWRHSVSWFDAARFANWMQNGQGSGDTETGAYTLVEGQTTGAAPARNAGAEYYVPTENQWYKAAFYKGGGTNAGYWNFATGSDSAPVAVTAGETGIGSAGPIGDFANYDNEADWNNINGNVTTVCTNGRPSAYDAYDLNGNVWDWNDGGGSAGNRVLRGGSFVSGASLLQSSFRSADRDPGNEDSDIGFRLAAVPEPSTYCMALAGLGFAGYSMFRRRKQA